MTPNFYFVNQLVILCFLHTFCEPSETLGITEPTVKKSNGHEINIPCVLSMLTSRAWSTTVSFLSERISTRPPRQASSWNNSQALIHDMAHSLGNVAVILKCNLLVLQTYGSGHETVAVLLPGFAINW